MKACRYTLFALWISTVGGVCDFAVEQTVTHTHKGTGVTLLSGEVALPTGTDWMLADTLPSVAGLSDIVLIAPEEYYTLRQGRRRRLAAEKQHRQRNRSRLRSLYWSLRRYAQEHEGRAPAQLGALEAEHWSNPNRTDGLHYIPRVQVLQREGTNRWVHAPATLLAFETKPTVDDGKHWQLLSDGTVHLVEIAPNVLAQHGATLTPGAKPVSEQLKQVPRTLPYRIAAIRQGSTPDVVTLQLAGGLTEETHQLQWDLRQPEAGPAERVTEWAQMRMWAFHFLDQGEGASVLTYWIAALARQYDLRDSIGQGWDGGRANRQASLFNVLGGRAAIRETLQLQAIAESPAEAPTTNGVDVATIKGVTVASHPFEEMLGEAEGGSLALADLAPPDRLFAYFAHPQALLQLMDGGADFIFRGGVSATGRSLEYRLTARYLGKLGLSEPWVRNLMKSGAVRELAVMLPDLFLVDGTDVTVACRVAHPKLAAAALAMLGLDELDAIVVRPNEEGGAAYWAQRGDLLLVSTQRSELDRVLAYQDDATGSLGQSAEFRYMLSRQPLSTQTRAYLYFSDPFVRRLVGPAVKIGQLRRLKARTELEAIAAGALLYQADGHTDPVSIDVLVGRGYVPPLRQVGDAVLHEDGTVSSEQYGSLQQQATLLDQPVTRVTDTEAEAYQAYVTQYNRFWRRFFDPIGIRLDQVSDREMALSVFILPLIDNSLYTGLREALIDGANTAPLALPALAPKPVATLSFNLTEAVWMKVAGEMDRTFEQLLGISPDILDHLGPDVHLAMGDADPIISLGSGELTGLAGMVGGGGGQDMFMIPMVVSMLTRPCVLMVGLDDPAMVRAKLRGMATGNVADNSMFFRSTGSLYQLAGQEAWHYVLNLGGMLNLRFGVEVKDRFLVISNLPFSYNPSVLAWHEAPRNAAALQLDPSACVAQVPALYASAASRQRLAAMSGLGGLYPLLRSGAGNVTAAIEAHQRIFGYAPRHPDRGQWVWDGRQLASSVFGAPGHERQPAFDRDDKAFGVLQGIGHVGLSMQFEADGLRSYCRWVLAP